jgi:hypothetical protein
MKCSEAKSLFSPYLDGAVTGKQMHALDQHLALCTDCALAYSQLQYTQRLLTQMRRPKTPADLALKLRVAISREAAQSRRPRFEGFGIRLQNVLDAFMVPATGGLLMTVLVFGLLMGFFAPLNAQTGDVPLMLYSGPVLEQTGFSGVMGSISDDSLVIEAYVDANGRVEDYRVLSDSRNANDIPTQVKNVLIFTTFRPAMSMGRPTAGRAVLSFSKISVRG